MDDLLSELRTLFGIGQSFVVSLLFYTHTLGGDAQSGTVHQCHDIFDEAHACVAAKFGLGILVDQFTGRRTVDAELVLDVAHVYAAITFVIDEHGQAAPVFGSFFGAGQNEVDVGVSVGDETLHAV